MPKSFSGLPSRPVSKSTTQALDHHPEFAFCYPMYSRSEDPEAVVVLALGKKDQAYVLSYNPDEHQWEQLVATTIPEDITEEIPVDDAELIEELQRHYDDEELTPAGYPNNPLLGTIRGFPQEPLTPDQINTLHRQHPMIGDLMPLVDRRGGGTIALIFFFDDVLDQQRITAVVGYEPNIGEWQLIDSAESSDPTLDQALDHLRDAYANWVATHYTLDEIDPIENPEKALES